jgi:hypothetical protein
MFRLRFHFGQCEQFTSRCVRYRTDPWAKPPARDRLSRDAPPHPNGHGSMALGAKCGGQRTGGRQGVCRFRLRQEPPSRGRVLISVTRCHSPTSPPPTTCHEEAPGAQMPRGFRLPGDVVLQATRRRGSPCSRRWRSASCRPPSPHRDSAAATPRSRCARAISPRRPGCHSA